MGTTNQPYRTPTVAEMRAQVERRVQVIELTRGFGQTQPAGDFTRIVTAAEQHLVARHKRGADLTGSYRLATTIATARAMGADACPDPLLASLARSSGVSYRSDMERAYPARVVATKPHDPTAAVRVMRAQIEIMRMR